MSQPMKVKVEYVPFKDIYISLSSEFIGDVKLLFRFLISWLVLELWPKDWTPMTEFSMFFGVFRPSCPHRQKLKILARQNPNVHGLRGFMKIWLNRLCRFREIWLKKKRRKIKSLMLCDSMRATIIAHYNNNNNDTICHMSIAGFRGWCGGSASYDFVK